MRTRGNSSFFLAVVFLLLSAIVENSHGQTFRLYQGSSTYVTNLKSNDIININNISTIQIEFVPASGSGWKKAVISEVQYRSRLINFFLDTPNYKNNYEDKTYPFQIYFNNNGIATPYTIAQFANSGMVIHRFTVEASNPDSPEYTVTYYSTNPTLLCELTQAGTVNGIVCQNGGTCQPQPVGNACLCKTGFAQPDCATCLSGYYYSNGACLPNLVVRGPCENYPTTENECSGNGFISPTHLTALYSSETTGNNITLRWDLDNSACNTVDKRYGSAALLVATGYQEKIQASNQEYAVKNFDTLSESVYKWVIFNECWKKTTKRFILDSTVSYDPSSSTPSGFSSSSGQCWIRDKVTTRTDTDECYRSFIYCKKQSQTTLESPTTGSVFKSVNSVIFRWGAVTFVEPECANQLTEFKYIFTIWKEGSTPTVIYNISTTLNSVTISNSSGILTPNLYRWSVSNYRIVPVNKVVEGSSYLSVTSYATQRTFQYCYDDVAPYVPTLLTPSTDLIKAVPETLEGVSVNFQWSINSFGTTCSQGTNTFVFSYSSSLSMVDAKTVTMVGTQTSLLRTFTSGTWYWQVSASNGVLSSQSAVSSFSICELRSPSTFSNLLPENGKQSIDFSNVTFSWQSSTKQSACATNTLTYVLYLKLTNETTSTVKYNGTSLTTTLTIVPGTYSWFVTVIDSEGQTRSTSAYTFATQDFCVNVDPTPTKIQNPIYSWDGSSIQAFLSWSEPSLGIVCSGVRKRSEPYFNLVVLDIINQTLSETPLGISNRSHTLSLSPGKYSWYLETYNSNGKKSASEIQAIEFCETDNFLSFAKDFLPSDESIFVDGSLTHLAWNFSGILGYSCLGGGISYSLSIEGETNIFTPIDETTTSFDVSSLQPGTWKWTISNDLSSIPITGLTSISYSSTFYTCLPGIPLSPTNVSPGSFTRNIGGIMNITWSHDQSLVDSCAPLVSQGLLQDRYSYDLFISSTSAYTDPTPKCTEIVNSTSSIAKFACEVNGLPSGLNYWKARVTKETLVSGNPTIQYIKESSSSLFSVCIDTAPIVPTLVYPPDEIVFERCNISTKFQWVPLSNSDFGVYCAGQNTPTLQIYMGLDPFNPNDKIIDALSYEFQTDSVSLISEDLVPNATYYWYLLASGAQFSTRSEIRKLVVPNRNLTACSGNGKCTIDGLCSCFDDFFGIVCENAIPTEPPTSEPTIPSDETNKKDMVPMIIGLVVGFSVLLLLTIIAFFFIKKRFVVKEKLRPPPDFVRLAFNPPEGFPPLDSTKLIPWYSFEQLLIANNFLLAKAIMDATQATEIDDVAKCLVYVIESKGKGADFVKQLISKDLQEKKDANTLQSTTLFRDNSHASKAFKSYSKIVGLGYLYCTLGEFMYGFVKANQEAEKKEEETQKTLKRRSSTRSKSDVELSDIVLTKSGNRHNSGIFNQGSVEVDPSKMGEQDDFLVNALMLQIQAQKIVVSVFRSSKIFPNHLSEIFQHLMNEVETSLSREDGYNSVAGFTFLRFINPSILFPHQYGLIDEPNSDESVTRQLILFTKVLQNLANGVHFGGKEQHMAALNDFIDSNRNQLRKFLEEILQNSHDPKQEKVTDSRLDLLSKRDDSESKGSPITHDEMLLPLEVPRPVVEKSLGYLYNHVNRVKDKTFSFLEKYASEDDVKITANKYQAIVTQIGGEITREASTKKQPN